MDISEYIYFIIALWYFYAEMFSHKYWIMKILNVLLYKINNNKLLLNNFFFFFKEYLLKKKKY